MFISKEVKALVENIDTTDDWRVSQYKFYNEVTGAEIWTANGLLSIDFHPSDVGAFNLFEKMVVRKAISRAMCRKAIRKPRRNT